MTDSPLDYKVKKNLIRDSLHILNLTWKRKNRYLTHEKNEMVNRLVGKNRISNLEKEALKQKKMRIKDKFENNNLGDFQNLYPLKKGICDRDDYLMEKYELIYSRSKDIFEHQ